MTNKEKAIHALASIGRPKSNALILNETELSDIAEIYDDGGNIGAAVTSVWHECMERIEASKATVDIDEPTEVEE